MNEKMKEASIAKILELGLVKPQTMSDRMREIVRSLGLRFLFWDTGYSLFFAGLTLAIVLVLFCLAPDAYRSSAAVAVAPLFFLFAVLFTETSERLGRLYELKMTCRYTIQQITALRVTCYAILGTAFTAAIAMVSADDAYAFLVLFPLCLSALFICAFLALVLMHKSRSKWAHAALSAAWLFTSITFPFYLGDKWETFLLGVPIGVSLVLALLGGAALAYQIIIMLREVQRHAVA